MPWCPLPAASIRSAALGSSLALLLAACGGAGPATSPATHEGAPDDGQPTASVIEAAAGDTAGAASGFARPAFVEAAAALGLDFVHQSGRSGERYFPEINGPGSALFDADGDGDLDLYLVQGGSLEAGPDPALAGRLYRNRLREDGRLGFEDMTAASGLVADGYGMGAAAGDIDNDGDVDLYLTSFGPNQLWRNTGDGRFEDVTLAAGAGLDDPRWSTSAAFLDYDRDGWLDLVVSTYTDFTLAGHKACYAPNGAIDYCGPLSYDPLPDRLLHNLGDGRFEDVTAAAGLGAAYGPGLGVVVADFDGDGWPDIYVANDGMPNQLWINRDGQRFDDTALLAGVAMNAKGAAEAGMGVVADDFDGDLDVDLFMTHLTDETNTLYLNDGGGLFEDATARSGLGGASLAYTGFGVGSLDIDGDGWLDLLVSNGAVRINPAQLGMPQDPADPQAAYRMPRQAYRNLGGRFVEATASAGDLGGPAVGRGASFGDLDDDGDPDAVLNDNDGPVQVLVNQLGAPAGWLGLRLLTPEGRDAYGARVTFRLSSGRALLRLARADGSHLASNDPRALAAFGAEDGVAEVEVTWPDGRREAWDWAGRPTDAYVTLEQGSGEPR